MMIPDSPAGFDVRNAVDLASLFLSNLSHCSKNTFAEFSIGKVIPFGWRVSRASG